VLGGKWLARESFSVDRINSSKLSSATNIRGIEEHPNYLTHNEGTTTKLISPFQAHPGLPTQSGNVITTLKKQGSLLQQVWFFKLGFLAYHHISKENTLVSLKNSI
jgi:hypothetical protein